MATVVKRLDLTVGEIVEVAGRRYEVVPDREGSVTIEPSITPATELHARRGTKPASAEDFKRLSVDVPFAGDSLAWNLIAFGERHPANERTRNVYERAHKRPHGRYP
jgi:hypothetical protein